MQICLNGIYVDVSVGSPDTCIVTFVVIIIIYIEYVQGLC